MISLTMKSCYVQYPSFVQLLLSVGRVTAAFPPAANGEDLMRLYEWQAKALLQTQGSPYRLAFVPARRQTLCRSPIDWEEARSS